MIAMPGRLRRAMKPRDWAVVLAGLALVAGIEVFRPSLPALPEMFPEPSRLLLDSGEVLAPEEARAMDEALAGRAYFGAFALGGQGGYGWAVGFATADAARAAALAYCAQYGPDCRVVAEIWPRDITLPPRDSLSFAQSRAFAEIAAQIGPRAFARALDGSYGTARGATPEQARAAALTACEAGRDLPAFVPPTPCAVIALWTEDLLPPPAD